MVAPRGWCWTTTRSSATTPAIGRAKIEGCGCTGGGKFWDVRNVRVTNNYVHDNKSVGLWADTNDNNFLFEGNWIENNDREAIFWETSYNVAIRNNVIKHNILNPARSGSRLATTSRMRRSTSPSPAVMPGCLMTWWAARPLTSRTT